MGTEYFPVGIIGLGPLGMAFATRLIGDGLPVIGYRRSGMDEFSAAGGIAAESPADLVARSEIVLDCLPHEDALLTLFAGEFSIMDAVRPGQVIVSLANHSLEGKQHLADLVAEKGGIVLDGAVDGTTDMMAGGQATIHISGDPDASERAASLLDRLASRQVHLGAFGNVTRANLVGKETR